MSDVPLTSAADGKPAPPLRVTIGLLFVRTTTTALTLGLASSLHRDRDAQIDFYRYPATYRRMLWMQDVLWFAASPAYGAALAAAAVAARRAVRRTGGFPTHPGHCERIVATAVTAIMAVVACLAANAIREPPRWRMALRAGAGGLCGLVAVIVAGRAAQLDSQTPMLWLLVVLPGLAIVLAVLLAGGAALVDLLNRQRYDLFHWLGILTLAVLVAHPALALALFWYF